MLTFKSKNSFENSEEIAARCLVRQVEYYRNDILIMERTAECEMDETTQFQFYHHRSSNFFFFFF